MDNALVVEIGLGIVLLVSIVTLIIAAILRRGVRYISSFLSTRYSTLEDQLARTQQEHSVARQKSQDLEKQLQEQRPEKLEWKIEQLTNQLEDLQQTNSELVQRLAQQKLEWLHQVEQLEQQSINLQQEHLHLLEEIERWHGRYRKAQQQVERLEQQSSEAEQKIKQLTQLRERLLEELREISLHDVE